MQRLAMLVGGIVLLIAAPAFAQDTSHGEFSAGLRYYHATLSSVVRPFQVSVPKNQPKGWYADAAANLSPKFALVGEAGGTYFSDESTSGAGSISIHESYDLTLYTFMGGVRVRAPQLQWFVPFGQVLFGAEHDNSSDERTLTAFQTPSKSSQERSSSNAALGLDSGATIAVGPIGLRASVGYVRFFSLADADAFRFSLGAAIRF